MEIPTGYQKGYTQGYGHKGYRLDSGVSLNFAGGLYQDKYKNWWGWKGNPDKGPQKWGQFSPTEHQSDWDPHWYSRIDPFITDQQKLADQELAQLSTIQSKLDEDIAGVAQQVKDFEAQQGEWERSFYDKMSEPRYINVGDDLVREDAVAGHIENMEQHAAFERSKKQQAYNKELMSLANKKTVGGVKTHRGLTSATSYSPSGGFNRSGMRIKNTSINI